MAVCITDDHDGMSFGGTTDPCAVGCVYSIGQINQENNAAVTLAVSELLEKHGGVANNRIYINFFDVPRANCGCARAKNLIEAVSHLWLLPR